MPRKEQTLSIEQLDEIIESRITEETFADLQKWAKGEKQRRRFAGNMGGKPRKYDGDAKERNRQAVANHRKRLKDK
jgi:hypothetical protein